MALADQEKNAQQTNVTIARTNIKMFFCSQSISSVKSILKNKNSNLGTFLLFPAKQDFSFFSLFGASNFLFISLKFITYSNCVFFFYCRGTNEWHNHAGTSCHNYPCKNRSHPSKLFSKKRKNVIFLRYFFAWWIFHHHQVLAYRIPIGRECHLLID